ncbi:MAG TPA: cytochrome c biogenesis protein CcsA [Nocardioidaceae bacterium]|nr:cytochrome c biogenesis protein CcsA [Nocardioidaceae bacterium]
MAESAQERAGRAPRPVLGLLATVAVVAALVLGLVVAPAEAIQGQAQRLMYVHVPAAWTAFCAFAVVLGCSVAVLMGRSRRWDAHAQAAAELGVGMTALAIVEGSIWGHSVWGVWWTWDARLVTTAVLLLLYLGYLGVRGLPGDSRRVSRRAAVVGVVSFVQVPVVHFSVLWWRTLHQPPTLVSPSSSPPIAPMMLAALLVSVLAFMLAGAWFVRRRVAQLVDDSPAEEMAAVPGRASSPLIVTRGSS